MAARVALVALVAAVTPPSTRPAAPRSWWRFEDAANIGADAQGNHQLLPAAGLAPDTVAAPEHRTAGGLVGGYLQFGDSNRSWTANASYLPLQCASPDFSHATPKCAKDDPALCANGHCPRGLTIELLIRLGPNAAKQGNLTLFESQGNAGRYGGSWTWVDLSRHGISFRAAHTHRTPKAGDGWEMLSPKFNGTGRAATHYLFDSEWHHVVFRRDTGGWNEPSEISIWIDGQNPTTGGRCESYTKIDSDSPFRCWAGSGNSSGFMSNFSDTTVDEWRTPLLLLPSAFDGAIDEVALYEEPLPDAVIHQHWRDAMGHKAYTFEAAAPPPAPTPDPIHGSYDARDYAPGTLLPTTGVNTQGVNVSALDQIASFPLPRYQQRNNGSTDVPELLPLGWSIVPGYLVGENQPVTPLNPKKNTSLTQQQSISVIETLATKFGYSLYFPSTFACRNLSDPACGLSCEVLDPAPRFGGELAEPGKQWCELVRDNPSIPIETSISRLGAISHQVGSLGSNAAGNQSLPKACYLQNAQGEFIGYNGKPVNCSGCSSPYKVIRPLVSSAERLCPYSLFAPDGEGYAQALRALKQLTGGGRGSDRFWNDGEQFGTVETQHAYLELDPVLIDDYEHAGIPPFDQGRDWTTYIARWRSQFTVAFRDVVLAQSPSALYSEYGVSGDWPFGKLLWKEMRMIFTPQSAARHGQRYSTPSIYPGASGPAGWDISTEGALDQLDLLRPSELATSDYNFAPFVAAGWQNREERSMRPGQWLGFLKSLATMGAEYFTVGYFNGRANGHAYGSNCTSHGTPPPYTELCPFQLAENYAWQTVMPSYAQAITSLWRPVLYDGQLLQGDIPQGRTAWGCGHEVCDYSEKFPQQNDGRPGTGAWMLNKTHDPEPVQWRFWAGSGNGSGQDKVVYVRKHSTTNDYVISGTIQPQSNFVGNAPAAVNVSILLNGRVHKFEIRRQGSVYAMRCDESGAPQVVVQLDGWHESTHPSHWSTDFELQAELHDDAQFGGPHQDARIATESIRSFAASDSGLQHHDFRDSLSYVRLRPEDQLSFSFEPRSTHPVSAARSDFRDFSIVLRARRSTGSKAQHSCVKISLGHAELIQIVCTHSAEWHECLAGRVRVPTGGRASLVLSATGGGSEIDWLKLVGGQRTARDMPECN
jgi:hypothetical protein